MRRPFLSVLTNLMIRNHPKLTVLVQCSLYIMTTTNAPSVSKRPYEPNDSKSSQIDRSGAMFFIHNDNNKCAVRF